MDNKFNPLYGLGKPNTAYAAYFIKDSFLNPLGKGVANVSFEPGCRNNFHIPHGGGQILLCTDGVGIYKQDGEKARKLLPGDVVVIPPNVRHFHGAYPNSWFAHVSVEVAPSEGTDWLEPVDDEEYLSYVAEAEKAN